jgi:RNA polymerase sigma-70 factor (ECF subfamily)
MTAVEAFQEHQQRLFSLAYRMLSSVSDAQDVLQEAYLRLERQGPDSLDSPGAWLTTVVSRLCLDRLRSARARRETYVGPWLPEPLVAEPDPADRVTLAESVSMAFLIMLESLSPAERVAFLLHDVFGYSHGEVAAMLGRNEAACRQLVSRARRHVRERRPRFEADPDKRDRVAEAFLAACAGADLDTLLQVLDPDVVLRADGGGGVKAARRPISGADRVSRFLLGVFRSERDATVQRAYVNGTRGFIVQRDGHRIAIVALDVAAGRVTGVNLIVNPAKLRNVLSTDGWDAAFEPTHPDGRRTGG